ncbi:MAG TPA: hypothetical protein VGQ58_09980 [Candidatus Limnocylindrales bacterium]|jgi:hypothetical protein|nr:hypothetical protein [Candidatus Limnocylindrales bacterium]
MGSFGVIRGIVFVVGALLVVSGFASLGLGSLFALNGLWLVAVGGFLMIVAVLERQRYRSENAERTNDPIGPGGGETDAVEPRFRPTDEVFVDPTTQRTMRVLVDPRTGERRYIAEA